LRMWGSTRHERISASDINVDLMDRIIQNDSIAPNRHSRGL
jgi:hypothetical protein